MEAADVTNEPHVDNWHSPYAPNPKLLSPKFHMVYKLEFLYLFDFQIVCIYHLSLIVHSLLGFQFRFKVCKLESHVYLLSKRTSATWVWHSRVYQVSTLGLGFTNWSFHICLLSKRTSAICLTFHSLSSLHLKFRVCKFWSSHIYFPKPKSAFAIWV
jgi:hypothetical protein